jgi:hypothetical protein
VCVCVCVCVCVGDVHDTKAVPPDGSVTFVDYAFLGAREKWLDYGCEHAGRTMFWED